MTTHGKIYVCWANGDYPREDVPAVNSLGARIDYARRHGLEFTVVMARVADPQRLGRENAR